MRASVTAFFSSVYSEASTGIRYVKCFQLIYKSYGIDAGLIGSCSNYHEESMLFYPVSRSLTLPFRGRPASGVVTVDGLFDRRLCRLSSGCSKSSTNWLGCSVSWLRSCQQVSKSNRL